MEFYYITLYILFGVIPSFIWLTYYLSKDLHEEPKRAITKVFLAGGIVALPVLLVEIGLSQLLAFVEPFSTILLPTSLFKWFVIIALTEELFKYFVVKFLVLGNKVLDEPLDIMLYMVVSALGFCAIENILYLFLPIESFAFSTILKTTITISFLRFIGATFLHTLCSALVGYGMALSFLRNKSRFTLAGIILATLLHGLYNFSIITLEYPLNFLMPVMIIGSLAVFMMYDFDEIKKIKSICKI